MILPDEKIGAVLQDVYGDRYWIAAAPEIGVSPRTVWNWGHGRTTPSIRWLGRIRRAITARIERLAATYASDDRST